MRPPGLPLVVMVAAAALVVPVPQAVAAAATSCPQAPTPGAPLPPLAPRDPLIGELALDQAWTLSTGAGVTVGVVDSGVDPASPKLRGAVELGRTYRVTDTTSVYTTAPDGRIDCDGHGTEVAGIIAGRTEAGDDRVSGIAPAARIYPIAIQGDIAQAPAVMIGAAIRDAADHSQVINLSFAQPTDSPDIRSAVEYALHRGVIVVAAASNDAGVNVGTGPAASYPAAYPGVLAVASVSSDGSADPTEARGRWISIAAPGDALTTVPRGGKDYVTVSGTSFATAIVSGVAALLKARFPSLSPAQLAARLEQNAVPPGDGSHDDALGYGTVDPFAALTASSISPAPPSATARGSVPLPRLSAGAGQGTDTTILGVAVALLALAVLVGLATLSVRSGRRRGWRAGALPRAAADERSAEPHPAELG